MTNEEHLTKMSYFLSKLQIELDNKYKELAEVNMILHRLYAEQDYCNYVKEYDYAYTTRR